MLLIKFVTLRFFGKREIFLGRILWIPLEVSLVRMKLVEGCFRLALEAKFYQRYWWKNLGARLPFSVGPSFLITGVILQQLPE